MEFSRLKRAYERLKSHDLNVMAGAQNRAWGEVARALKGRRAELDVIRAVLDGGGLNRLDEIQAEAVLAEQGEAASRHKTIAGLIAGIYNSAKRDLVDCRTIRGRTSPYKRTKSVRGGVRA